MIMKHTSMGLRDDTTRFEQSSQLHQSRFGPHATQEAADATLLQIKHSTRNLT